MEGSCSIDGEIYNYSKTTKNYFVDCSEFFNHRYTGFVKFKKIKSKYGTGAQGIDLVPFKSIAVDKNFIPLGSKIYIPEAKGIFYDLNGISVEHDGIFYAHDTGGLINGNHIDFFIGLVEGDAKNPFDFIKSNPKKTFEVHLLNP